MNNIRKYREEKGISQADLADKLKVNQVTISRWETGEREPNNTNLIKLSMTLGKKIDDLLMEGLDHSEMKKELKEFDK